MDFVIIYKELDVVLTTKTNFSHGPLHTDVRVLPDQQELIYNTSVRIQDVDKKTYRKRWMIETENERKSGKSILAAWHDDDDDDDDKNTTILKLSNM